jgi:arylsulfatase
MEPNVLLLIMDSVRARSTSLHGHFQETTPFLDAFAERAVTYSQAKAPGAKSLTSHISIFTGFDVEEHNITSADDKLSPGHTIFERLADSGYATGVFTENTWLTDVDVGLKEGFDTIEGPRNIPFPEAIDPKAFVAGEGRGQYAQYLQESLQSGKPARSLANGLATKLAWDYPGLLPDALKTSTAADVYADQFLAWEQDRSTPWAACINFMDAHIPYEPREEHDRWGGDDATRIQDSLDDLEWVFLGGQEPWWKRRALEGLYEGAIRQIDAEIERILTTLDERGALENTLVVITSDHGEGFGERDEIRDTNIAEHGISINEEVVHVPLLVQYPEQTEAATVETPVSLTRFPAVVDAVIDGDPSPEAFVPAGPVVVSAAGLTDALAERAGAYVDDLEPFMATSRATYTEGDDSVMKDITWRDRSQALEIWDAQHKRPVRSPEAGEAVDAAFAEIADAGVRQGGAGKAGMDDSVQEQLEDLGYM